MQADVKSRPRGTVSRAMYWGAMGAFVGPGCATSTACCSARSRLQLSASPGDCSRWSAIRPPRSGRQCKRRRARRGREWTPCRPHAACVKARTSPLTSCGTVAVCTRASGESCRMQALFCLGHLSERATPWSFGVWTDVPRRHRHCMRVTDSNTNGAPIYEPGYLDSSDDLSGPRGSGPDVRIHCRL